MDILHARVADSTLVAVVSQDTGRGGFDDAVICDFDDIVGSIGIVKTEVEIVVVLLPIVLALDLSTRIAEIYAISEGTVGREILEDSTDLDILARTLFAEV